MDRLQKIIFYLFAALFFFIPLVLWPATSEVFEFNKMVLVYLLTASITATWLIKSIFAKKFIFRRTILDTPLLIFLGSQLVSTILSIDPLTSWLGYYSRFNGGLLSAICYSLLYWAFVSNFEKSETLNLIKVWLGSAALVSIYGVLEHFGIDKNIWVQDVQSRVFSTLGQPNWLAAWLVALLPITWVFALEKFRISNSKFLIYFSLSVLFFWTLIFTKSRSGLLGFAAAFIIFWGLYFWKNKNQYKKHLAPFFIIISSIIAISLISGTELTPGLSVLLNKPASQNVSQAAKDTALETGGTESGTIRKIVWKGALAIWARYPVFGTGVETFAFSYYKFRPVEHNLTSEWDFIYNKAHNEFLNVAANSGTVGLLTYLALIGFSIYQMIKTKDQNFALLAGYASLSVTNFFGFSVVPTQLEFFLFPAFAIALAVQSTNHREQIKKPESSQKIFIFLVLCTVSYVLFTVSKYWYADLFYAKGKAYNSISKPDAATGHLTKAISFEPNQALYHSELATSDVSLALAYYKQKDLSGTKKFTDLAIGKSDTALSLSPANLNLKRSRFGIFIMLSTIDRNYLINARDTLIDAIASAPTDAKLFYNLGLTYARIGQPDLALATLKKTIELKSDYKEARLAYAILLIDQKQNAEARVQLEYILKYIDPNDSLTVQTLESVK